MLSQILTLYTTPMVYLYLDRPGARFSKPMPNAAKASSSHAAEPDTTLSHESA